METAQAQASAGNSLGAPNPPPPDLSRGDGATSTETPNQTDIEKIQKNDKNDENNKNNDKNDKNDKKNDNNITLNAWKSKAEVKALLTSNPSTLKFNLNKERISEPLAAPNGRHTSGRFNVSYVASKENFFRRALDRSATPDWNLPISMFLEHLDNAAEVDEKDTISVLEGVIEKFDEIKGQVGLAEFDLSRHNLDIVPHLIDQINLEQDPEDCYQVGNGWHYLTSDALTDPHEQRMAVILETVSLIVEANTQDYRIMRKGSANPAGRRVLYYFNLPSYMKMERQTEDAFKIHLNAILNQFDVDIDQAIPGSSLLSGTLLMTSANHQNISGPVIAVRALLGSTLPQTIPDFFVNLDPTKARLTGSKLIKMHFANGDNICVKCKSTKHIREACPEKDMVTPKIFRTRAHQGTLPQRGKALASIHAPSTVEPPVQTRKFHHTPATHQWETVGTKSPRHRRTRDTSPQPTGQKPLRSYYNFEVLSDKTGEDTPEETEQTNQLPSTNQQHGTQNLPINIPASEEDTVPDDQETEPADVSMNGFDTQPDALAHPEVAPDVTQFLPPATPLNTEATNNGLPHDHTSPNTTNQTQPPPGSIHEGRPRGGHTTSSFSGEPSHTTLGKKHIAVFQTASSEVPVQILNPDRSENRLCWLPSQEVAKFIDGRCPTFLSTCHFKVFHDGATLSSVDEIVEPPNSPPNPPRVTTLHEVDTMLRPGQNQ